MTRLSKQAIKFLHVAAKEKYLADRSTLSEKVKAELQEWLRLQKHHYLAREAEDIDK